MLHRHRRFGVANVVSADELAERLTSYTWTPCTAFRLADLVFANDSTSPDGIQEYAVIRDGRQIESITFGWCDRAMALHYITELINGTLGKAYGTIDNIIEPIEHHARCAWCR